MHFWQQLRQQQKPFFTIAPMADVTDAAFRRLIASYAKPDVVWTEFVSANGLMSGGRDVLLKDLMYTEAERPIVAQLFSADPAIIRGAAKLCAELGFDGIDINMGCPDKTIEKQGAGAAMIKTPEVAVAVIKAVKDGIADAGKDIPVSVKTRAGYSTPIIQEWITLLLQQNIAALTIHARTRKDLSKVPADWEYVREVVTLRDRIAPATVVIGNGDVVSRADGIEKAKMSGCDGVMVGRALFGNPWFFDPTRAVVATLPRKRSWLVRRIPILRKLFDTKRQAAVSTVQPITTVERLGALVEHSRLFEELLGDVKSFSVMKKHVKAYVQGFAGAKELRMELMEKGNAAAMIKQIVDDFLTKNQ